MVLYVCAHIDLCHLPTYSYILNPVSNRILISLRDRALCFSLIFSAARDGGRQSCELQKFVFLTWEASSVLHLLAVEQLLSTQFRAPHSLIVLPQHPPLCPLLTVLGSWW